MKKLFRAFTIVFVLIFIKEIATGKRVVAHIIVRGIYYQTLFLATDQHNQL